FAFRNYIANTSINELERGFSSAAIAARKTNKRNAKALLDYLGKLRIDDDRFVEAFAHAKFERADVARYVLAELNVALASTPEITVADDITLEHVLPKNPNSLWKDPLPDVQSGYVDLIGNLSLLERNNNQDLGNCDFASKKVTYAASKLALNKTLISYHRWTVKEIEDRSKKLAAVAKSVWRVDC